METVSVADPSWRERMAIIRGALEESLRDPVGTTTGTRGGRAASSSRAGAAPPPATRADASEVRDLASAVASAKREIGDAVAAMRGELAAHRAETRVASSQAAAPTRDDDAEKAARACEAKIAALDRKVDTLAVTVAKLEASFERRLKEGLAAVREELVALVRR